MRVFLTVFFGLLFSASQAQIDSTKAKCDSVYTVCEEMPVFPGGELGFMRFLSKNLRATYEEMPCASRTLYFQFVIDTKGIPKEIKLMRSYEGCEYWSNRVLEAARKMPDWSPGKSRGKPVCVQMQMPVRIVWK